MTASENDKQPKPWEALLAAVSESFNGATKSVNQVVSGGLSQVKQTTQQGVTQAQELTSSARIAIRRVGGQATKSIKDAMRPIVEVFEKAESTDGTVLRKQIAGAREQINYQLHDMEIALKATKESTTEQLRPVQSALASAQTQLIKVNEFRREHPEAAVAGLVAVVGLPSLLIGGKVKAARNVLLAVGSGAAVAYGADRLKK